MSVQRPLVIEINAPGLAKFGIASKRSVASTGPPSYAEEEIDTTAYTKYSVTRRSPEDFNTLPIDD